jgi:hypothetical protein
MRKTIRNVLLAATLVAIPAHAAGVDPASATAVQREQAQQHFLKGKDRYDRNDMNAALDEFRASLEIVASPNARLYVARTLREMGRLVEAYVELGRTAADAKEHEREDGRYGKAATAALAERDAIAPQIGFVQLTVKNASDTTTVTVGGNAIVRAGWNDPIPVKPGNVDIVVATPGAPPVEKTPTLHAGQKLALEVDANEPPSVATNPVPEHPASSHGDKPPWLLPAAIVGGGVGVVGMLTFTIAGVASNGTFSDLQKKCGAGPCPASDAGEVSSGKTQQAIANTGLVLGLLGFAAGATFLVWWVLPQKSSTQRASAAITFGPSSIGVAGTF